MAHQEHAENIEPQEALDLLFAAWTPTPQQETLPVEEAIGRVLAQDQYASINVPTSRASCMDAVAVRSADFKDGMPDTSAWKLDEDYAHADTGDDFDDKFDAIIAIESVDLSKGYPVFDIDEMPEAGDGINPKGSKVRQGELLLQAHNIIQTPGAALLATGGISQVPVITKPKVAFIPTGSELVAVGETPGRGQVVDCNSLVARQLLGEYGAEPILYPIVRDDREALSAALDKALEEADIVILNGGSSKGSEDFNHPLLAERGTLLSHWMLSVPGRPLSVSTIGDKLALVIPGPTVGCINVMDYFVAAVIDAWYGIQSHRQVIDVILGEDLYSPEHMMMYIPMQITIDPDGWRIAKPCYLNEGTPAALKAQGYLHSPIGESFVPAGSHVEVSLFGTRAQGLVAHSY